MVFGRRGRAAAVGTVGVAIVVTLIVALSPAARADDPPFIEWADYLPGLSTTFEPNSANDCNSGRIQCVDAVIREMTRRFDPLAASCDHDAVFSLTYLRTTEEYRATVADPTFFSDTPFINHQDAVFADYYFDAYDAWHGGRAATVPQAWQIALDAADHQRVSGAGNLLLGMGAHVNRDLPYVLAAIGLVKPDGTSRKPDHDKVNEFLSRVIEPLLTESSERFDPTIDDTDVPGTSLDATGAMQLLVAWREAAWRNAESLVAATTPWAQAQTRARIEAYAVIQAQLIKAATAYSTVDADAALSAAVTLNLSAGVYPVADMNVLVNQATSARTSNLLRGVLGPSGASARNSYCAAHWSGA